MNDDLLSSQNRLHFELSSVLEGAGFRNAQRLLWNSVMARYWCRQKCDQVIACFHGFERQLKRHHVASGDEEVLSIEPYSGANWAVLELKRRLKTTLGDDLAGAYVHGSLGTYEEIAYSDFDALLIIRDEVFESCSRLTRVAASVIAARKVLWDYDPLQHHGFFVLTESDLQNYPENVFPRVLFQHAKSLLPQGALLDCNIGVDRQALDKPLLAMLEAVDRKIKHRVVPKTLFDLKLLLSQIMLLPSLYLQAMGTPVFKRESFSAAMPNFEPPEWHAVEVASRIRERWPSLAGAFRHRMLRTIPNPFLTGIYQKKLGFKTSRQFASLIDDTFWKSMGSLSLAMRTRIQTAPRANSYDQSVDR